MIVMLAIVFVMLALWQIPKLARKHWWQDLIVYTVLWSVGCILSIMLAIGITLPPITTIICKSITVMFGR